MGAANWVSGGVRRAMSGVRSALPGQDVADALEAAPTAEAPATKAPASTKAPAAKKPAPKEPAARKPAPKKPAAKRSAAKKSAAKKSAAKKSAPGKPAPKAPASTPEAPAGEATGSLHAPGGDAAHGGTAGGSTPAQAPWTDQELDEFRAALVTDITRLREELNMGQADLAEMLAHGDGAGDDQADAGAKTLDREQEMSVAANARELLDQSTHALQRLENGTYGRCESCGTVIPAPRLRAFPRATLCIACKQAEERG
jgi:RNA polymerase-binding protein DksA